MEMFCEYLPDSIREVAAGQQGKSTCGGLQLIVKCSQQETKQRQFGIPSPSTLGCHTFFKPCQTRKIVSTYPDIQVHHMQLNTQNPVISMKVSLLLGEYICPSARFSQWPVSNSCTSHKTMMVNTSGSLSAQFSYLVSLQMA